MLELGRRLYRSGENDYLLNKQRIRLRDLVDLLDAAHLADNAFLFIGQGMVDQALALRPEERRPLFEEVAGVRRHERRRRRAEEQLAESEANLARVEDILAELRPQARRLAAQAEQQASRETTADELAGALLARHARPLARGRRAAGGRRGSADRAPRGRRSGDGVLAAAEAAASALSPELGRAGGRSSASAARSTTLRGRPRPTAQLREARLASELEALERDRRRLIDERVGRRGRAGAAAGGRWPSRSRRRDLDLEAALGAAERELADALAELGTLRSARAGAGRGTGGRSGVPRRRARPSSRPPAGGWPRSNDERPRKQTGPRPLEAERASARGRPARGRRRVSPRPSRPRAAAAAGA